MESRIALAQASGPAGEAILARLAAAGIASDALLVLDHASKIGRRLPYGDGYLALQDQHLANLSDCAILMMPEADAIVETAALEQGCLLLSHAIEDEKPALFLSAPEPEPVVGYTETRVRLAGAELCCLLPVLLALNDLQAFTQLGITLIRSVEFRGRAGIDELASQTINLLNARDVIAGVYAQQIAFNMIPELPDPRLHGDLNYFLGNSSYSPTLQTLSVPVFHGFAAAVHLQFQSGVELEHCRRALTALQNIELKKGPVSPVSDCNQSFNCVISHLSQPSRQPLNLQLWMVSDPMRYGLANNYVNVLESLLKSFL